MKKTADIVMKWVSPESLFVIISSFATCFFAHPYRINLFLAWDGAYRIAEGSLPFVDFGTPVGYVFWLIPAFFFKIFGSDVFTLIITQSFLNCLSGLLFLGILRKLQINRLLRIVGLIAFVFTYSLLNIWPWYNHLVFVWELCVIWFILSSIERKGSKVNFSPYLIAAGVCTSLAFMTKQDTGFLTLLLALALVVKQGYEIRSYRGLFPYLTGLICSMALLVLPFVSYDFAYWFNMGQSPHYSRINLFDLINEFFGASSWIKLYLLAFWLIAAYHLSRNNLQWLKSNSTVLLIGLFILFQAAVIQVTSYTPENGNIYFQSFSIVFILHLINLNFTRSKYLAIVTVILTGLWSSNLIWNRFLLERVRPYLESNHSNAISKNTFKDTDNQTSGRTVWITSDIPLFKNIKLPRETVEGIKKLTDLVNSEFSNTPPKVLNFTELTQLAAILPYDIEKGSHIPLWYHKGVSFFDREKDLYCNKISLREYDIILFEDIPDLNNFYSYDVLQCIENNYHVLFEFKAPRVPEISRIIVFVKPTGIEVQ